jgi:hypothetical protein
MPRSREETLLERWVNTWREAAPALEAQKRAELEGLDTCQALAQLESAFEYARLRAPVPDTSGLVEQQRHWRMLRR